ncbi:DUF1877 family protein [Streptomyces sp. 142MFCol3.1]|uniref:DUF1877 family protein n=1 Tax=Streptomyces sp. 142MFCol3.1 TaxID=1172179 RepID=UPI001319EE07|nr:DUF1877 family protein [Streptomyces sp. 142MFCol3.1]
MSVTFRLRRFRPEELNTPVEDLLEMIPLKSSEEDFARETQSLELLDLGSEWDIVHAALTGGDGDTGSIAYQPVMGGALLGRTEREIVVRLTPDQVRAAADFTAALDRREQVGRHLDVLADVHGGEISERFAAHLVDVLNSLCDFYAAAAAHGDAVVKAIYS